MEGPVRYAKLIESTPTPVQRYVTMLEALGRWGYLLQGKSFLDFGCSWDSSAMALMERGAETVVGVT